MDDVAARAGVSVTTVSHVLNGVPGKRIRRETRDRVRQAADEMGYVLNGVARSLRTRGSQVIAMIGDGVAITPFAVGIIVGAQEATSRLGWLLVHVTTRMDCSSELAEIQALRQRQVDGFLYARKYQREVIPPEVLHDLPVVFGFDAHVLDTATVRHVEPAETRRRDRRTTAGCGPTDIVRIVVDAQTVLLAVATHWTPLLLRRADAATTVPWTAGTESMKKESAEDVFDLMPVVAIHPCHPSGPDTTVQPQQSTRSRRRWHIPPY